MSMIFHSIAQWRTYQKHHLGQQQLGVVLTMGNLHQGHLALCAESQRNNDATVVSIFVNPTQFNDPRDYECYPRTIAADMDCLRQQKVDFILLPQADELYADQFCYQVSENSIAKQLEGEFRPGHFTGMLTIVLKLLLGIGAHRAYFGEKDYQQYLLIKGMVKSFFINCEIIACPIVRENSVLPFSSRNQRLSVDERVVAEKVAKIFNQPQMPLDAIRCDLLALGVEIDYLCEQYERRLMAVRVGEIRLLDNYSMDWG